MLPSMHESLACLVPEGVYCGKLKKSCGDLDGATPHLV